MGALPLQHGGIKKAIDAKTVANTTIFTTENGTERFYPLMVCVEIDAQAAAISSVATISVGITSAAFADLLVATPLTGLTAVNKMLTIMLPATVVTSIPPNTAVVCRVSVGAIGVGATQSFKLSVIGFYD